jgi:hypothetical protein
VPAAFRNAANAPTGADFDGVRFRDGPRWPGDKPRRRPSNAFRDEKNGKSTGLAAKVAKKHSVGNTSFDAADGDRRTQIAARESLRLRKKAWYEKGRFFRFL